MKKLVKGNKVYHKNNGEGLVISNGAYNDTYNILFVAFGEQALIERKELFAEGDRVQYRVSKHDSYNSKHSGIGNFGASLSHNPNLLSNFTIVSDCDPFLITYVYDIRRIPVKRERPTYNKQGLFTFAEVTEFTEKAVKEALIKEHTPSNDKAQLKLRCQILEFESIIRETTELIKAYIEELGRL